MEDGGRLAPMAVELVDRDRLSWLFWWKFVASLAWVMLTHAPSALSVMSVCNIRSSTTFVAFRRFVGDVRREFMQRLFVALHGTRGSFLRVALQ